MTPEFPKTLHEAIKYFADPETCQGYMVRLRWPDGVFCARCGDTDVYYIKTRRIWQCKGCKRQFSVKVGTIFEDSPIGLDRWLTAVWLIASAKNGISSYELHKAIGVTQKSAWFMLHRIRLAMQTGSFNRMGGEVEVDETYIGGKSRNMHKAKRQESRRWGIRGKAAVMGLLERHGPANHSRIKAVVVPGPKRKYLHTEIIESVEMGSTVYTDQLESYNTLQDVYNHQVINHAEAYARGNVHTNGLENFWSLLKRSIHGTYVNVEPFHLFRYLDEHAFRFNTRKATDGQRFDVLAGFLAGRRVTYAQLTGRPHDL